MSSTDHHRIFLSLGSNMGSRCANLDQAINNLQQERVVLLARSSLYETEPVGIRTQREFVNMACEISCSMNPRQLLSHCLSIERDLGRVREVRNGPRKIDVDIIFFGDRIIEQEGLIIPHAERGNRRFVLTPLAEIAPEFRDPITGKSIERMLEDCKDPSWVRRIETRNSLE